MKEAHSVISCCCRFAVVVTHAELFPHNLLANEHCPSFCLQSSSCGFFVALNLVVSVSVTTATQRQLERYMGVFNIHYQAIRLSQNSSVCGAGEPLIFYLNNHLSKAG